jgi:Flp pilus assembly pilin Flp
VAESVLSLVDFICLQALAGIANGSITSTWECTMGEYVIRFFREENAATAIAGLIAPVIAMAIIAMVHGFDLSAALTS